MNQGFWKRFFSLVRIGFSFALLATALLATESAYAEPISGHVLVGAAHALGEPQQSEFSFGVVASGTAEFPVNELFSVQAELGLLLLAPTIDPPTHPKVARHTTGLLFALLPGVRVHPLGKLKPSGL